VIKLEINPICEKCHRNIVFGYSIEDVLWKKLPSKYQNSILCFECFLEELEKRSPNTKIGLNNFYFMGILGDYNNNNFGGILIDSDNKKNKRIYL
jgi:hypothetical protein